MLVLVLVLLSLLLSLSSSAVVCVRGRRALPFCGRRGCLVARCVSWGASCEAGDREAAKSGGGWVWSVVV